MRARLIVLVAMFLLSVVTASIASADIILPEPRITICVENVCVTVPG